MSKKYRTIVEKLTREGVWCYETGRYAASRRAFAKACRLFETHLKNDAVADRYRWTTSRGLANALAALGETEHAVRIYQECLGLMAADSDVPAWLLGETFYLHASECVKVHLWDAAIESLTHLRDRPELAFGKTLAKSECPETQANSSGVSLQADSRK